MIDRSIAGGARVCAHRACVHARIDTGSRDEGVPEVDDQRTSKTHRTCNKMSTDRRYRTRTRLGGGDMRRCFAGRLVLLPSSAVPFEVAGGEGLSVFSRVRRGGELRGAIVIFALLFCPVLPFSLLRRTRSS